MPHLRDRDMSLPIPPLSLRTTNLGLHSDMEYDSHSSSAYPASSATSDSEVETPISPNSAALRSSISSLQDFELRTVLVKLAEESTHFQHAIMKEVAHFRPFVTDTHTPTKAPKTKKSKTRSKSRRNLKNLSVSTEKQSEQPSTAHVVYHPGMCASLYPPSISFPVATLAVLPHAQRYSSIHSLTLFIRAIPLRKFDADGIDLAQVISRKRFTSSFRVHQTRSRSRSCARSRCGVVATKTN